MKRREFLLGAGGAALAQAQAGTARLIVSSAGGDRMRELPPVRFGSAGTAVPTIEVVTAERYQTIDGFGATFTEAGMMTLNKLFEPERRKVFTQLFDRKDGAGFSLMKSPLAAFDFASGGPWFSYDDVAGDTELKHFSIARDLEPSGILSFVKAAQKYGRFQIQSTMDFPPDWMLDEKLSLKREYYDACARYQVKYLKAYADAGVRVDYLAPFNEPEYIYCKIKFEEVGDYIRDHLGPRLRESKLPVKLQLCESNDREIGFKEYPGVLRSPGTREFISSLSLHGYGWDHQGSGHLGKLHGMFPDLPLWQSEVCYAYVIDKKPMPVHGFEDGDRWGRMIIADIENWASGWIYWNMILDHNGGPWLISEKHGNPKKNDQHPVVIVDTERKQVEYPGLYWYLAHFSKFVRPGAVRVRCEGRPQGVSAVAFTGSGGTKVLEVVNSNRSAVEFAVREGGKSAAVTLPAMSIGTLLWGSV
jgi:glucosylceramidase